MKFQILMRRLLLQKVLQLRLKDIPDGLPSVVSPPIPAGRRRATGEAHISTLGTLSLRLGLHLGPLSAGNIFEVFGLGNLGL